MNTSEDNLATQIDALIKRYQKQIDEKNATIEALTADLAVLSAVAVEKGAIRELPENEAFRGGI